MPTIQQIAAKLNRGVADTLIRNLRAMPEDKATWQPMDKGRTALSQVQECAIITGFTIYTLEHHELPSDFNEAYGRTLSEIDTVDKAIAKLEENTSKLVDVIQSYPDANLEKTVTLPWENQPSTMAELMFVNYWNAVYHIGQISYIQTLYGDNEMH